MSADIVLDVLRRSDPARELAPLVADARARVRAAIVAAPLPSARPRLRRSLALAAVAVAMLAAGGWTVYETVFAGPTAQDVRSDFAAVTRTIPLPPGARWRTPSLEEQGVYPGPQARMIAILQATCAWFAYWRAGDGAQRLSALHAEARIRILMPVHREPEDAGGFDASSFGAFDAIVAAQQRGDPAPTSSYLRANCG
jgi:hypothetical protein